MISLVDSSESARYFELTGGGGTRRVSARGPAFSTTPAWFLAEIEPLRMPTGRPELYTRKGDCGAKLKYASPPVRFTSIESPFRTSLTRLCSLIDIREPSWNRITTGEMPDRTSSPGITGQDATPSDRVATPFKSKAELLEAVPIGSTANAMAARQKAIAKIIKRRITHLRSRDILHISIRQSSV
jgi:hypothetical protein